MARLENGQCGRCRSRFGRKQTCQECGAGAYRPARRIRRRRPSRGKRGRNSGVTGTSKKGK